jgi:hypothetical protein
MYVSFLFLFICTKTLSSRINSIQSAFSTEEMFDELKYVCLINDCLLDESKPFDELKSSIEPCKTSAHEDQDERAMSENEYNATLMENLNRERKIGNGIQNESGATSSGVSATTNGLDSIYDLNGVCNLVILFHKSLTLAQAKKLLVYDLMRSLYARIRLLVEDLDARKDIIGDAQLEDPNCKFFYCQFTNFLISWFIIRSIFYY